MAKRFKLKFPRVIHSLQFCRLKDPSSFPVNPIPAIYRLSPTNPKSLDISFPSLNGPPPTPERYPSTKRHVSSKNIKPKACSSCCRCQPRLSTQFFFSDCSSEFPDYSCKTSSFAITKKYYFKEKNNKEKKTKTKNKKEGKASTSVSSGKNDWFSSEGEEYEECKTLVDSSRSLSDVYSPCESSSPSLDTSYEKPNVESTRSKKKKKTKVRRLKRHPSMDWRGSCSSSIGTITKAVSTRQESESTTAKGGGSTVLRRMMGRTVVEGKAKESFAVVKKSEDPYEDFKRSMLEMIMEKQMFNARDLEELLQCFLTLNSQQYHEVIVEAFSEIWQVLFCDSSVKLRV